MLEGGLRNIYPPHMHALTHAHIGDLGPVLAEDRQVPVASWADLTHEGTSPGLFLSSKSPITNSLSGAGLLSRPKQKVKRKPLLCGPHPPCAQAQHGLATLFTECLSSWQGPWALMCWSGLVWLVRSGSRPQVWLPREGDVVVGGATTSPPLLCCVFPGCRGELGTPSILGPPGPDRQQPSLRLPPGHGAAGP